MPDSPGDPESTSGATDSRIRTGLITFCYRYAGGLWYRGESPDAAAISDAIPGVWSAATTAELIARVVQDAPDDRLRAAAEMLVSAAPSAYAEGFRQRFQHRQGSLG
ncbi:hypothetical protein [Nocardia arthritidis]|uniref:Uncharacterized protein n=1 Tax=Nocardia arthritidis TaxID=228602 RepID=A0A6G9Y9T3_9NOCA|nr:hypothetical protein [Nocardia arthritidis]QIS09914.1 hypothetical protein F5544_10075 [Nocardia arthritidis]